MDLQVGFKQTNIGGYEAALEEHAKIYLDDLIIHVACLAHVRRKFHDAVKCGHGNAKDAEKALAYIQKIYFLENRLREQNLDDELILLVPSKLYISSSNSASFSANLIYSLRYFTGKGVTVYCPFLTNSTVSI